MHVPRWLVDVRTTEVNWYRQAFSLPIISSEITEKVAQRTVQVLVAVHEHVWQRPVRL
jgi:hypothetical protein